MRVPFKGFGFDVSPNPEDPPSIRKVELWTCGVIALYRGKPSTCFPLQRRKVRRPVGDVYRRIESGFDGRKGLLVVHQIFLHAAYVNVLNTYGLCVFRRCDCRYFFGIIAAFAFRHNCPWPRDE